MGHRRGTATGTGPLRRRGGQPSGSRLLAVAIAGPLGIAGLIVAGGTLGSTATAATTQRSFGFTGAAQTFSVPAGVCSVTIAATGGYGGEVVPVPEFAGFGGTVNAKVTVTPGSVLTLLVGGRGANGNDSHFGSLPRSAGGFNGGGSGGGAAVPDKDNSSGGGGGGASSILAGSVPLVVAGGGGGLGAAAYASGPHWGDAGHPAGQPGQPSFFPALAPAQGGTQTAGGAGGANDGGSGSGQPGTSGTGGDGTDGGTTSIGGGGGGGGYFGGGGGGSSLWGDGAASGGGGGSSFGPSDAVFGVSTTPADGSITISYGTADGCTPASSATTVVRAPVPGPVAAEPSLTG